MTNRTQIEYADRTWNPIIGCQKVSEGCRNCFAERQATRNCNCLAKISSGSERTLETGAAYTDVLEWPQHAEGTPVGWNGRTALRSHTFTDPLDRQKPTTYLVCDMGDLFCESVPTEWIDEVFSIIAKCPQHTFLILTKRAQRMRNYFLHEERPSLIAQCQQGVTEKDVCEAVHRLYLGVSVENQKYAMERIPPLLTINAAGHFISCEPLLGPLDLQCVPHPHNWCNPHDEISDGIDPLRHHRASLDQVIVGGESGPDARPMHPDWVREVREDCAAAAVPFFFKQWGKWLHIDQIDDCADEDTRRWMSDEAPFQPNGIKNGYCAIGKNRAGRTLDGRTHDELIWRDPQCKK